MIWLGRWFGCHGAGNFNSFITYESKHAKHLSCGIFNLKLGVIVPLKMKAKK